MTDGDLVPLATIGTTMRNGMEIAPPQASGRVVERHVVLAA